MCPRYKKDIKSTSNLTRYVNACKISIILPSCQSSILALILEYNPTNYLHLPLDNFEKNIGLKALNNGKKKIRPVNTTDNNDEKSRTRDIN